MTENPDLAREVDDFLGWYCRKRRRTTGSEPAQATLKFKRGRLRWASEMYSRTNPSSLTGLMEALGDRGRVVALMDDLDARMTPGASRQVFYALRDLGEYAVAKEVIPSMALEPLDCPSSNPPPAIDIYTEAELELLRAAAYGRSVRFGHFIAFLAETGRRVGEGLKLEWAWFRLEDDTPHISLPTTKIGRQQYIPLTPLLREKVFTPENIEQMKEEETGPYNRPFRRSVLVHPFPWGYNTVNGIFGRLCENCGVENRGFHNFRHTVITNRLAAGWPLQAVAALAGHQSPQTTATRYNHTDALTFAGLLEE